MRYAIIGFGRIGHAIAGAFARSGVELSVATTRDPESFASDAAAIGPTIVPRTLAEAVKVDVMIMTESERRPLDFRHLCQTRIENDGDIG